MGRRTLLLIAAVLLAAIGTGVLFLYVTNVAPSSRSGGTVGVLAPATRVPGGTTITDAVRFETVQVSAAAAQQSGMIAATRRTALDGQIANRELLPLVPVTAAQFGGAVVDNTRLGLADGRMGLTLEFTDPGRVADLLVQGSRVAVWLVDSDVRPHSADHEARLILPEVTVLTIGNRATIRSPQATGTAQSRGSSAMVTLDVDQKQAAALLLADASGRLHLTLLGGGSTPTPGSYDERLLAPGAAS